jgi:hypothetical protein
MTTRRWMLGVAVVAVMFGYVRPAIQMWRLADYHHHQQYLSWSGPSQSWHRSYVQRRCHARMEQKYRRAVWFPWLTVEPEPLPP